MKSKVEVVQVQVAVPYKKNHVVGVGVVFLTGSPMGKVVTGEVYVVTNALDAVTSFSILRLDSTEDPEQAMGISLEARACGCFSEWGRMDYTKKSKIQINPLFKAITAYEALEILSIDDPTMTPTATDIAGLIDAFNTRYGDMFVRVTGRGGLFLALVQIDTRSSWESESISGQVGGSYGLFSAKAKTTFKDVQKQCHSELKITVSREGGPVELSTDKDKIDEANELCSLLHKWL